MQDSAGLALPAGAVDRADRSYITRLVALFCAGWAVIYADRTVLYPLLSVVAEEFRMGRLSDRIGRKRIVLGLLPLMALSLLTVPQVESRTGMLLVLLVYGLVGKLAWDPVGIAWLGDYAARTRPEAVGAAVALFSFTSVMSAVIGPPLTGWIKDMTGSLAGGFYLAAVLAMAAFFLSLGPADSGRRDSAA